MRKGKLSEALSDLGNVPNKEYRRFYTWIAHYWAGQYLAALDQIEKYGTKDGWLLADKAIALNGLGRAEEALAAAEESLTATWIPSTSRDRRYWMRDAKHIAYNQKARALLKLQRLDRALESVNAALKIDPWYAQGLKLRAEIFEALGRKDDASKDRELGKKLQPFDLPF